MRCAPAARINGWAPEHCGWRLARRPVLLAPAPAASHDAYSPPRMLRSTNSDRGVPGAFVPFLDGSRQCAGAAAALVCGLSAPPPRSSRVGYRTIIVRPDPPTIRRVFMRFFSAGQGVSSPSLSSWWSCTRCCPRCAPAPHKRRPRRAPVPRKESLAERVLPWPRHTSPEPWCWCWSVATVRGFRAGGLQSAPAARCVPDTGGAAAAGLDAAEEGGLILCS